MAQRAFLHIGGHKTGTSAVQQFLADNGEWLQERGIYVPKTGQSKLGAHHQLVRSIAGLPSAPQVMKLGAELKTELQAMEYPHLFISSETMIVIMKAPVMVDHFVQFFSDLGYDVTAIFFARDPVSRYNSGYAQRVKSFSDHRSFDNFVEDTLVRDRRYQAWRNILDSNAMETEFHPYNQDTRQRGIVPVVLKLLGIQRPPNFIRKTVNKIPGPIEVLACRRFMQSIHQTGNRLTELERAGLLSNSRELVYSDSEPFSAITPEFLERIMDQSRDSREELAHKAWNKSWDECFEHIDADRLAPNCIDLLGTYQLHRRELDALFEQQHQIYAKVKVNLSRAAPRFIPLNVADAMIEMGFEF